MSVGCQGERAHEKSDSPSTFGGKLQPARLDPGKMLNRRDGRADAAATQAFGQCPKFLGSFCTAKQDEMPQVDPRRRQSRRVQLASRIAPYDRAAFCLGRFGQQQCEGFGRNTSGPPEQFMHRAALECAAGSQRIQFVQSSAENPRSRRQLQRITQSSQLSYSCRLHHISAPDVRIMLGFWSMQRTADLFNDDLTGCGGQANPRYLKYAAAKARSAKASTKGSACSPPAAKVNVASRGRWVS
jgi:hypothetical protein